LVLATSVSVHGGDDRFTPSRRSKSRAISDDFLNPEIGPSN
jgi:hypothetical protein